MQSGLAGLAVGVHIYCLHCGSWTALLVLKLNFRTDVVCCSKTAISEGLFQPRYASVPFYNTTGKTMALSNQSQVSKHIEYEEQSGNRSSSGASGQLTEALLLTWGLAICFFSATPASQA